VSVGVLDTEIAVMEHPAWSSAPDHSLAQSGLGQRGIDPGRHGQAEHAATAPVEHAS